jgi:hypothetical protein
MNIDGQDRQDEFRGGENSITILFILSIYVKNSGNAFRRKMLVGGKSCARFVEGFKLRGGEKSSVKPVIFCMGGVCCGFWHAA